MYFSYSYELDEPDEGIGNFAVTWGDKEFNAECVKGKNGDKRRVNEVAGGIGEIDHLSEHKYDIGMKILTETSKKRGIRNPVKATEILEFPVEGNDEPGIGRIAY